MASVDEARTQLRSDLNGWIEARLELFSDLLDADEPMKVPMISDFRLVLCVEDAADNDASVFYPTIGSDTPRHRHVGLLEWAKAYLLAPD